MDFDFADWFDLEQKEVEGFRLVDLSETIEEQSIVPGEKGYSDPDVVFATNPWVTLDIKPYYITKIVMGAHVGTHIDAPMHALENGKSVDQIPNVFIGPALIVEADEKLDDVLYICVDKSTRKRVLVDGQAYNNYWIKNSAINKELKSLRKRFVFYT